MNDFMRRVTALGRPLDPEWPTNRAVLVLIPLGVAGGWVRAVAVGHGGSALTVALLAGAAVLLAWALGRELAPDPQGAAFVSLGIGYAVYLADPGISLLLAAVALVSARVVNRTTGLPATPFDLAGLLALVVWAVSEGFGPAPALAGGLALALDASLPVATSADGAPSPLERSAGGDLLRWIGAVACLALGLWAGLGATAPLLPAPDPRWSLPSLPVLGSTVIVTVAAGVVVHRSREIVSRGDETGLPLVPARVRGGVVVVLVLALLASLQGDEGVRGAGLVWGALAGVALWRPGPGRP